MFLRKSEWEVFFGIGMSPINCMRSGGADSFEVGMYTYIYSELISAATLTDEALDR